jgi:hypothetical protein
MQHAKEGLDQGLGLQGATALLRYANTHTADTDGSTTAIIAVRRKPNIMEVSQPGNM